VASWEDVAHVALSLPQTGERESRGLRSWRVREKLFVWERPLRASDLRALAEAAPEGPILGARVEHLGAKQALIADGSGAFFTTPHFDGYAAILARLELLAIDALDELVTEAWLCCAPRRLAADWLAQRG
jgi:hypothetical protein